MSDTGNSEISSRQAEKRLGIFDANADEEVILGVVTLSLADDGNVAISLGAETDEALQRIQSVIPIDTIKAKSEGRRTLDDLTAVITQMVLAENLYAKDLPPTVFQMDLSFDMKSGRMLSKQRTANPHFLASDNVVGNIHKAISEGFAGIATELANSIRAATEAGDHAGAIETVEAAMKKGDFAFAPNAALMDALASIDLSAVDVTKKGLIRERLMQTAYQMNRADVASAQATLLLKEMTDLSDTQKADLELVIAHDAIKRGQVETAMSIWRRLLNRPEVLKPSTRGWTWRNISMTLAPTDSETRDAARHSADAFLEAGDKEEASRSMMVLAKSLFYCNPEDAIQVLNEIEELCQQEGLRNTALRAGLSHVRGNRLSALGDHSNALEDALKAVELMRGLNGTESELISSLYLVQQELNHLGRYDEAKRYGAEADDLSEETNDPHFQLAKRVTGLIEEFDAEEASKILAESRKMGNHEVTAAVRTLQAMFDQSLSDTERLSELEACLAEQEQGGLSEGAMAPARQALVQLLIQMGHLDRAERLLEQILQADPTDLKSRDILLDLMWRQEEWGEAVIFIREQIDRWGEMRAGLTCALGKSLLKSGNLNEAVQVLTKASNLAGENVELREYALQLREEALQSGGTVQDAKIDVPPGALISREEFEQALSEFCGFVAADKRMTFWNREGGDYKWIMRPEGYSQNLLHTYLKGRFGNGISVYEELAAGAGRLDIYLRLRGGLSIVLELKMCGFGYSSNYAASGEVQLLHYMENRDTYLGYLVVFDARLNSFGKKLLPDRSSDQYTVTEVVCDVQPRVSMRKPV